MRSGKRTPAKRGADGRACGLRLHIANAAEHAPFLRRHLKTAHVLLDPPLRELGVALVGDKRMSDLHLRFMNVAGPTDVLTFPLEMASNSRGRKPRSASRPVPRPGLAPPAVKEVLLGAHPLAVSGEVVICVPEARRRCREHGTTLREELLLYALHGMLHLCGFDDRTASDFEMMHRTEDDILARLGVGPVFDRRGTCRPARAVVPGDD